MSTSTSFRALLLLLALLAFGIGLRSSASFPLYPQPERNELETDDPLGAAIQRQAQLRDEHGQIPVDGLMKARAQIQRMQTARPGRAPASGGIAPASWSWLGPGNIGGRIRSILPHPLDPNTLWVGSVGGGIWKTADGGASWQPVNDFMANLAVSSLIMDPTNFNTLYAGTGEGFYNVDAIQGAGVFQSTDGGVTWNQLPSTATSDFTYVNRLALARDASVLLAATRTGVWRSTTSGAAWTHPLTVFDGYGALDVLFHPTDPLKAVASGQGGKAWYTLDGGASWMPAASLPGGAGRVELAYAPSTPTVVYASIEKNGGELWKSANGGQSYGLVNTGNQFLVAQGWYDNTLWVDPTNSSTLVVGGVNLWRSTNAGATLTAISDWRYSPNSAHADHHVIVSATLFDGAAIKTVYFGNDGGIYKADDVYTVGSGTQKTGGWQNLDHGLAITQFYSGAGSTATGTIVAGAQDNGMLRYTPAQGPNAWNTWAGGDGGFAASDSVDPNYLYGEYVYLQIERSTDGAATPIPCCPYISTGIADSGSAATAYFIAPYILDPNNPNTMLAGGTSLWRTVAVKDPIPTWDAIKPPIAGGKVTAITVAAGNSNLVWVGYDNGTVSMTTNGADPAPTWVDVSANGIGLPARYVTRIWLDPANASVAYITFGGFSLDNIYRSPDAGLTWTAITGAGATALPAVPVRSLVTYPANPAWIYAGTESGVFVSEDTGTTWKVPQDGPANVSVDDLFWMGNSLVAVTHGRGVARATLFGPAPSLKLDLPLLLGP